MNKILVIMDGMTGVTYHRLAMPFAYIRDKGYNVEFAITEPEIAKVNVKNYNTIVLSRHLRANSAHLIDDAKKNGVKIIVDIDDYWVIPKYNGAYNYYKEYAKSAVLYSLANADMVWASTPILASKVAEINPNVYVLPNYIDTAEGQWNQKTDHVLTIGYVGGDTHLEDIKLIRDYIKPLCIKNGYRFLLGGYTPYSAVSMEMEYYITGSRNRPEWFYIGLTTSVLHYGKMYANMDVCLAPLQKSNFNQYKSELKILEAGAYNLPIVCSDVAPYTLHSDNKGVVFAKNNDWSCIEYAVENRIELGKLNAEYCDQHHNIDTINAKRISLL
jgi:glycosyltransferase involved in cell wall biosynthesis